MAQTAWGLLVIVYLFLGGLGAGAFLTAAYFELSGWRDKPRFSLVPLAGATLSGPLVALGSLLLVFDLGAGKTEPMRILALFANGSSVMTWGIWILSLFIPVALLYGFLEIVEAEPFLKGMVWARLPRGFFRPRLWRRGVAIVGSFLAVGTAVYTGVLLSAVGPAVPLWSQPILPFLALPMMPVLFLVSALSTGLGAAYDLVAATAVPRIHHQTRGIDLIHILLVSLEAILIGLLLITSLSAGGAAGESARVLLYGPLKWIFWLGVVLVGLLLPFVVHAFAVATGRHSQWARIGTGAGTLVAGLFLRYLIVTAGIPAQL